MPEDTSPFGTYLLIALVAVGAAAGGYYFKVYKPKHEYEDEDAVSYTHLKPQQINIECPLTGRKGAHTMAYVPVPKDLTKVKTKVAVSYTHLDVYKRQR